MALVGALACILLLLGMLAWRPWGWIRCLTALFLIYGAFYFINLIGA
jgi:hypothetical protein